MLILLVFLCFLANAATYEHGAFVSVLPFGIMGFLQPPRTLPGGNAVNTSTPCCPQVSGVGAGDDAEEEVPPAKRRCIQSEGSPEEQIDTCSVRSHETQTDDEEGDCFEEGYDCPYGKIERAVLLDDQQNRRQQEILSYLDSRKGCFVPEKDLQKLHGRGANEVLEDVMGLIAEQHHITYKDKQYRLSSGGEIIQLELFDLRKFLLSLAQDPEFNALSAAEQSYDIYERKGFYVPVSTVAVWTEMYKTRLIRGLGIVRFIRILYWKSEMLQIKKMLKPSECVFDGLGVMHGNDVAVIRRSMQLHAQGREVLAKSDKHQKAKISAPLDIKHPEVLQHLQNYKGQPVCELTLRHLMAEDASDHRRRDLIRLIAILRAKKHNISCTPSKKCLSKHDQTLRYFTLEQGEWEMNKYCYKTELWQRLHDPERKNFCVTEVFLELSNDHYNPIFGVVDGIVSLKKALSCAEEDTYLWKTKRVFEIAQGEGEVRDASYYQKILGEHEGISGTLLRNVKRYLSYYRSIYGQIGYKGSLDAHHSLCASALSDEDDILDMDLDVQTVDQDIVVEGDVQENFHRQDILSYLESHKDWSVPEEALQQLNEQSADEVLEDVMGLIAKQHNITYKDKQYRLCSGGEHLPLKVRDTYEVLADYQRNAEFQELSVAKQSYFIYASKRGYIPVSTLAVWSKMQDDRLRRGAARRRFQHLLYLLNKTLQTREVLSVKCCLPTPQGPVGTNDLAVIRRALKLYAQGREILESASTQKESSAHHAIRWPEILQCLQDHAGQPVCESELKVLITGMSVEHKQRTMCSVIGALRAQRHNIICTRAPVRKYNYRPNGGLKYLFTFEEGEWDIRPESYKKALWKMLDNPKKKGLCVSDVFLELSNNHYDPLYHVVEEIVRFKKLMSCTEEDEDFWKRQVMEVVLEDGKVLDSVEYYQAKTGTTNDIKKSVFQNMKRYLSHYQKIQGAV